MNLVNAQIAQQGVYGEIILQELYQEEDYDEIAVGPAGLVGLPLRRQHRHWHHTQTIMDVMTTHQYPQFPPSDLLPPQDYSVQALHRRDIINDKCSPPLQLHNRPLS